MNISIISQGTEEEGTLSILHYLSLIDVHVDLLIESKLYERIAHNTNQYKNISYTTFSQNDFIKISRKKFMDKKNNIVLIPRIDFRNDDEFNFYKEIFKNNFCYVGLLDHDRWLGSFWNFFLSQIKRPSKAMIRDQKYCRKINKYIYGYLLFELDRTPDTIITRDILKEKKKYITFPFKRPFQDFNLNIDENICNFVITGNIQEKRRDYFEVLNTIDNDIFSEKEWNLTLLGRPIGNYGNSVINQANQINKKLGRKAIKYYEEYIPKEIFDNELKNSTHLIAPLNTELYKKGKTSGAIYDAIALNKHLIIPKKYFEDTGNIGLSTSIVYESSVELKQIITSVVEKNYDYVSLKSEAKKIKEYIQDSCYASYITSHFENLKNDK